MIKEFTISTDGWSNQSVVVSDSVVTILRSHGGKVVKQLKISDLVDVTLIPVVYELGGRKLSSPHGLLRLATSWAEQRVGFFGETDEGGFLGVYFNKKSQDVAVELEGFIRGLPSFAPPESPYLSQVSFLTFTLSLTKEELIVTHAPGYARLRHLLTGGFQPQAGEAAIQIEEINGISFEPATSEMNYGGSFNGVLTFETATTKLTPGVFRGPFQVRFPKSMNTAIREFAEKVRIQQSLVTKKPSDHAPVSGLSTELSRLFELKEQGVLSEDEFSAAKRRLLES